MRDRVSSKQRYHHDLSPTYLEAVAALERLSREEGGHHVVYAFAEAISDVWKRAWQVQREDAQVWHHLPDDAIQPLPDWVRQFKAARLGTFETYQNPQGLVFLVEHVYDFSPRHAMRLQRKCARLGLQWTISARSWRFPAGQVLLEVFQDDQSALNHPTWTHQVMESSVEPDQETPNA